MLKSEYRKRQLTDMANRHGFKLDEPGIVVIEQTLGDSKYRLIINIWEDNHGYSITYTHKNEEGRWELEFKTCYTSHWEILEYCLGNGVPFPDEMGKFAMEETDGYQVTSFTRPSPSCKAQRIEGGYPESISINPYL